MQTNQYRTYCDNALVKRAGTVPALERWHKRSNALPSGDRWWMKKGWGQDTGWGHSP